MDKIDELATMLLAARENHQAIAEVPDELVPADLTEAQLVDDRVAAISGWPVLGWKIGATSAAAQKILGAPGPFAGRVYSVLDAGAEVSADDVLGEPRIEGEFAFTLARDFSFGGARSGAKPDRQVVLEAVADVRPAIEVVGGRYADMFSMPLACLVADAGANGLLVLGEPCDPTPDLDGLAQASATMTVDGEVIGSGVGSDVHGGPIDALLWLVHHLADRGVSLQAGQVVSTGTATQVGAFATGSTATAELAGVGAVSAHRVS